MKTSNLITSFLLLSFIIIGVSCTPAELPPAIEGSPNKTENCLNTPFGNLSNGIELTAFQSNQVPFGQSCLSERRVCSNGLLSGSYTFNTCTVTDDTSSTESLSVSGTIFHGQILKVKTNGTYNFGQKSQQSTLIWDDFSAGIIGQLVKDYNTNWQGYQSQPGALISNLHARYPGAKSAYNDTTRHGFSTNFWTVSPSKKRFVSYWFRTVDTDINDYSVIKLVRVTSSAAAGGGGVYNGVGSFALSNMNPRHTGDPYILYSGSENSSSVGPNGNNQYIHVPFEKWTKIEMSIDLSDMNISNGRYWVSSRVPGGSVKTYGKNDLVMRTGGIDYLLDTTLLGVMHANSQGAFGLLNTQVYTDNSWARVAIGSCDNYETCSNVEEQPYVSWGNNEISIKLNIAAFSADSPLYLWFIDEENVPSTPIQIQ